MAIVPPNAETRLGDFRPIIRASEGTLRDVRILLQLLTCCVMQRPVTTERQKKPRLLLKRVICTTLCLWTILSFVVKL